MSEISINRVLAIGAAGNFAGMVVPELAAHGATVRGFLRDATKADAVRARGAAEIAIGDLRDRASLERAMAEVDGVFYIGPLFAHDEAELGMATVEIARRAGVRRFAFSSLMHPGIPLAHHAAKLPVEAALQASGMDYTILQPSVFFQNLAAMWPKIVRSGQFSAPYSKDMPIGFVDYRDVAEAAAIALTGDRLAHASFELCAEAKLTRRELAERMSEAARRRIEAVDQTPSEWESSATFLRDEREKALLMRMYAYYDHYGYAGNSLALSAVLGRAPRRISTYLHELVAAAPDS